MKQSAANQVNLSTGSWQKNDKKKKQPDKVIVNEKGEDDQLWLGSWMLKKTKTDKNSQQNPAIKLACMSTCSAMTLSHTSAN